MSVTNSESIEAFLVEDMILTLVNLRASLEWLSGGANGDVARHRSGWDRFDRQLEMLEARARDLLQGVKDRAGAIPTPDPAAPSLASAGAGNLPLLLGEDEDDIDNVFRLGPETTEILVVFQSRRHAG